MQVWKSLHAEKRTDGIAGGGRAVTPNTGPAPGPTSRCYRRQTERVSLRRDGVKCAGEKAFRVADFSPARNVVPYGHGDGSMALAASV